MSINDIFVKLENTAGRNDKIQILKDNDSPLLRAVIQLALDPFTQFYIRKIPAYQTIANGQYSRLEEGISELFKLSDRVLTGNDAVNHLTWILEYMSPDDAKVIERIIAKDLKCKVAEGTVNKAFGDGFVLEWPVMLCSPSDEKLLSKFSFPAFAQLKMDGMRFNAVVEGGKVSLRSRNGKFIDLFGHLEKQFLELAEKVGDYDMVFDGELLVYENGQPLDRKTGNGILNKAVKNTISDEEAQTVHATIWDVITLEQLDSRWKGVSYEKRFSSLTKCSATLPNNIHLVTNDVVDNVAEANVIFQKYLEAGQEGIILKDPNALWENKRVKHQVKFKAELPADLLCIGWEEGTGKNVGRLGALKLQSSDGVIKVDVGTGFTDQQRIDFTEENTVGRVVEIIYNARVNDKRTGQESLFLPVFVQIREDKNTADSSVLLK